MSSAFLKKSLELVDSSSKVIKRKEQNVVCSKIKFINRKKKSKDLRGAGDVRKKNIEAVERVRKEHKKQNNRKQNKFKVKLLHKPVKDSILNKILKHIQAPGFDPNKKKEEKVEEKTVFTEEDFAKFEKEYFAN